MMPSKLPFYIVDVFCESKFAGNQLAVVRRAESLTDREMREIAREFNFSETSFIRDDSPTEEGYDVRIFTPVRELPFAGHPTLGTVFIIQQEIVKQPASQIVLNLKAGKIPVDLTYEDSRVTQLTMTQIPPTFGSVLPHETAAEIVGLEISDLDTHRPVQVVSTGVPVHIIPVKTLSGMKRAAIDVGKLTKIAANLETEEFLLFSTETYSPENDLNVRFFAPTLGVPEDPATGSGNGCLAAYLLKHGVFGSDRIRLRAEQGLEIGRPSLLHLSASQAGEQIRVQVGGRVILIARGELV